VSRAIPLLLIRENSGSLTRQFTELNGTLDVSSLIKQRIVLLHSSIRF